MVTAVMEKKIDLDSLYGSINLSKETMKNEKVDIICLNEEDNEISSDESRLCNALKFFIANSEIENVKGFNKGMTKALLDKVDAMIHNQINEIIHDNAFKEVESAWTSIDELVKHTDFGANIKVDVFDTTKEELEIDFDCNSIDVSGSAFFKKIYFSEYDQFGGEPYGSIISLFDFDRSPEDINFLSTAGKICSTAHAPFIGNVSPDFFNLENISDIEAINDLEGMMKHSKYRLWNNFRELEESVYIGLCMPRYIAREPWSPEVMPAGKLLRSFKEKINELDNEEYLWGKSSILYARNLVRSFRDAGWCQFIRGPKGGGLIENLPSHTFSVRGKEELKAPVECILPDNKELALAKAGIIPLIYEKGTTNACFFSSQSAKAVKEFKNDNDSEDTQLVSNLAYTYSVCRIAHYIKTIGRLNIGSAADAKYLERLFDSWITGYVTSNPNPDEVTLRYFPFKKAEVKVEKVDGKIGWYKCNFKVLPHLQFEGLDAELALTTTIDKKD